MFDGVGWAAGEIVSFMLASLLVGFAIGWIFGRWMQRGTLAEDFESQLTAERERTEKIEARLNDRSADLDRAQLDLKGGEGIVGDLQAELQAVRTGAADLEVQVGELAEKDTEIERLTAELAGKSELEAQPAALDDKNTEIERLTAELAGKSELEAQPAALDDKNTEIERLTAELAGKSELEAQLAALDDKNTEIERLTAELAGKSELEAQLAALDDKNTEIERLGGQLESCGLARDRLTGDVSQLQHDLTQRNDRIEELEAKLEGVAEPESEPEVAPEPEPEPVVAPLAAGVEPTKEEAIARIAEIAKRTAGGAPAADDDLKKVHGIGPKLERTLKGLGITSFRQIANFHENDIAFVTAALDSFRGRIERDDWMSSAAEEHAKKYDEPV
jgi:predicted flap endonuclease-1-like 5' DNA nuclease